MSLLHLGGFNKEKKDPNFPGMIFKSPQHIHSKDVPAGHFSSSRGFPSANNCCRRLRPRGGRHRLCRGDGGGHISEVGVGAHHWDTRNCGTVDIIFGVFKTLLPINNTLKHLKTILTVPLSYTGSHLPYKFYSK